MVFYTVASADSYFYTYASIGLLTKSSGTIVRYRLVTYFEPPFDYYCRSRTDRRSGIDSHVVWSRKDTKLKIAVTSPLWKDERH
ncbi:hypothetical protein Trydic_g13196 [Trypoxylus dichotomus]